MNIQAAIFDMDGLLLDSERICRDCFVQAGQRLGIAVEMAVYHACIGANEKTTRGIKGSECLKFHHTNQTL